MTSRRQKFTWVSKLTPVQLLILFYLLAVIYQDVQIGGFHRQSARALFIFMIT